MPHRLRLRTPQDHPGGGHAERYDRGNRENEEHDGDAYARDQQGRVTRGDQRP